MKTSARLVLFAAALLVVDHDRPALGTPAGFALSATHLTADGISTGTVRLSTLSVTSMPSFATRAWVKSVGDWFVLSPTTGAASDGITVVSAPDGRQWVRQLIPNPAWRTRATWSIDESNVTGLASDENTGADDTHPLLTINEFVMRMGRVVLQQAVTVRWLSDAVHFSVDLSAIVSGNQPGLSPATNYPLVILGVPTVVASGTLTSATDAPWTVTDSALPVSWGSSGCLSTSSGVRVIRKADKTKHAMMAYENSAKTAQISPTNGFSEVYSTSGAAAASFTSGDAYEVLSLPKFPYVTASISIPNFIGTYFILLDMQGVVGGSNELRFCGWRASASLNSQSRGGTFTVRGAIFVAGGSISGSLTCTFSRSIVVGGVLQTFSWQGDMNGLVNVVAKTASFQITHGSLGRIGIVYVYDNTASQAIEVSNMSLVTVDAIHGSGNTGGIVNIRDSGCAINSPTTTPLTAFDATTSAAHPITVVGTQYDYTAIPIQATTKNAWFVTN